MCVPVYLFYRGIGLLTEKQNQKFSLEREIVGSEDEGVQGDKEVVSDNDDIESVLPSAKVHMSNEDFGKRLVKRRRKLQTHLTSEDVG